MSVSSVAPLAIASALRSGPSLAEIRRHYPGGSKDLFPHVGPRGAITDDTQMMLFTTEGIIRALIRGELKGICHPPSVIHHALLRWYKPKSTNRKFIQMMCPDRRSTTSGLPRAGQYRPFLAGGERASW
ncbi:MAG: ADP-ribosylglycohydrolase family protein [Rhodobacterales bacterium]|nr:ADP-ribosylglycohydrolase family protein [Rhodobacterales bacterium]